ncbi:hypothetical protein P872_05775 [Rhodonellum psychrophilum GCM71 = DSM 17998]|uniref:histidine kinase n=3 Tax=Cytophagaceae TaxID=89373 RepID=U5BXE0_9BACT|nr:hypothetical protein P872_05775 [Rhodonellum psychrophilum GCM71 = DSM 17998]SDY54430.1 Histidine kinase [Rhodonellum ikkaensis]
MNDCIVWKKRFGMIVFLCFLVFSKEISANPQKDSLETLFQSEMIPSKKMQLLKQILPLIYKEKQSDALPSYYLQAIKLAEETKDFDAAANWSIALYQFYNDETSDQDNALQVMQNARQFVEKVTESRVRGNVFLKLGAAHYVKGAFDSAIWAYTNSISHFSKADSIYVADALFFRGQAKDYLGKMLNAMKDYQLASTYYENLGDLDYVNHVQNGMSILFSKYEIFDEAEKIRLNLIDLYAKSGDFNEWAVVMYNQSNDYRKQGRFVEQHDLLNKIMKRLPQEGFDPYLEVLINLSMSNYYGTENDLEKQQLFFSTAEKLIKEKQVEENFINPSFAKSHALLEKTKGNLQKAITLARSFKTKAMESNNMDLILEAHQLEADLLEKVGDNGGSLLALKYYQNYKDSIFGINKANTFAYYQTLYETEKKEREILKKNQEIEKIQADTSRKITLIIYSTTAFLAIIILLFLWKNLRTAKKERSIQERFSRELISSQENERRRISKDLHDGLGQSLLLIKNRVAMSPDTSSASLLDQAIEELRGISRSLHPFQLYELGITGAIQNILDKIDREMDIFIASELENIDDFFSKEDQVHIYRIVQETFTNILKHSEASAANVTIQREEKKAVITIKDNGIGFDFSEKYNDFNSLGLKTLKERTAALKGTMKVDSEKGAGTIFSFIFSN